jgi:exodeoxyribonuclease VII small subunit
VTYQENLTELENIVRGIESGDLDVDVLAESVARAAHLIQTCREKLRTTDEAVKKALSDVAGSSRLEKLSLHNGESERIENEAAESSPEEEFSYSDADCPLPDEEDCYSDEEDPFIDPFAE